ncbi:MAG: flagellar biosynthesis anti-sigma factor FlgM [Leptothrix sp. (in: Bacteria)]|nr:flagellar biosynthesis anti-sigma factor FlgM [Leptothrix sp. (in: b-proteobacteria)]
MKIGPIDTKPPAISPADRKAGAAPAKTPDVPSTEVALSAAATGLSEAAADASFDGAKVERIAGAIREGKFTVNAEAIADKLISNAEELLGRKLS